MPLQFCIGTHSSGVHPGSVCSKFSSQNRGERRKALQDKGQNAVQCVKTGRIPNDASRDFSRRSAALVALVLVVFALASGCRRRAAEVTEYKDPHPLPEEPLVIDAPSIGRHGGRFVLGSIQNPRTFNAMMANEQSSGDITERTFARLTDYDNVDAEDRRRGWPSRGRWRPTD